MAGVCRQECNRAFEGEASDGAWDCSQAAFLEFAETLRSPRSVQKKQASFVCGNLRQQQIAACAPNGGGGGMTARTPLKRRRVFLEIAVLCGPQNVPPA